CVDSTISRCCYREACFTAAVLISCSSTFRSMSASLLIYRQPPPVLYLPSFCNISGCAWSVVVRYREMLAFRGEKPMRNQSTSRPLAGLLYRLLPKPINEAPHIFAFCLVAFSIILSSTTL